MFLCVCARTCSVHVRACMRTYVHTCSVGVHVGISH